MSTPQTGHEVLGICTDLSPVLFMELVPSKFALFQQAGSIGWVATFIVLIIDIGFDGITEQPRSCCYLKRS